MELGHKFTLGASHGLFFRRLSLICLNTLITTIYSFCCTWTWFWSYVYKKFEYTIRSKPGYWCFITRNYILFENLSKCPSNENKNEFLTLNRSWTGSKTINFWIGFSKMLYVKVSNCGHDHCRSWTGYKIVHFWTGSSKRPK